ncbi:SH3 domain-containing protein [Clostridium bowmanii]|uniref:SH3 domain-containing protein n=1 Tax=Clostridium bowmanii TaxID=132925 RepID=UPI001C0D212F|nr:SH3 domain-containing protein [Clostridium bowmanii]MBU3188748.1 SH3 domain-containing protein [Clostridium bowmanii]MCA1073333.1 SH3 domain-containing protein [Clostridium bowmanii]
MNKLRNKVTCLVLAGMVVGMPFIRDNQISVGQTKNINVLATAYKIQYGKTTIANLVLRSTASISSKIVGKLNKGTNVVIAGKIGSFYKITYLNKPAYVSVQYIKIGPKPVVKIVLTDAQVRAKYQPYEGKLGGLTAPKPIHIDTSFEAMKEKIRPYFKDGCVDFVVQYRNINTPNEIFLTQQGTETISKQLIEELDLTDIVSARAMVSGPYLYWNVIDKTEALRLKVAHQEGGDGYPNDSYYGLIDKIKASILARDENFSIDYDSVFSGAIKDANGIDGLSAFERANRSTCMDSVDHCTVRHNVVGSGLNFIVQYNNNNRVGEED